MSNKQIPSTVVDWNERDRLLKRKELHVKLSERKATSTTTSTWRRVRQGGDEHTNYLGEGCSMKKNLIPK